MFSKSIHFIPDIEVQIESIPAIVTLIPTFLIINAFGWMNTYFAFMGTWKDFHERDGRFRGLMSPRSRATG